MNYPVPMPTPRENAKFLDNSRLNKFISEFQQMINRAIFVHGGTEDDFLLTKSGKPYKTGSHPNHPATLWICENKSNFLHAVRSTLEFYRQHKKRGGGGHDNVLENVRRAMKFAHNLPSGPRTPFVNCAAASDLGISYKDVKDVHLAYIMYYNDRWDMDKKEPRWTYDKSV